MVALNNIGQIDYSSADLPTKIDEVRHLPLLLLLLPSPLRALATLRLRLGGSRRLYRTGSLFRSGAHAHSQQVLTAPVPAPSKSLTANPSYELIVIKVRSQSCNGVTVT